MFNLRRHQKDMIAISKQIKDGDARRLIIASVTPGGGKSMLPAICAHHLIPGIADKICWVVPRDSLRRQAETAFMEKRLRAFLGHDMEVRASCNDLNPSRDTYGYITTYQAIGADPDLHADEFMRRRYLLVLDEPHHIGDDKKWKVAISPLFDSAALRVLMSGTFERGDGQKIAFMPYHVIKGRETPNLSEEAEDHFSIVYTRRDALRDKATLLMYFERIDCRAEWISTSGSRESTDSLAEAGTNTGSALYTALNEQYAMELLGKCVDCWSAYKKTHQRSKLLVVSASISRAKDYLKWLRANGYSAEIATSEDSEAAKANIKKFREAIASPIDVLVTVAMAYEGLDVPAITHVAVLTHIRSTPWIEQMLNRATRVDEHAGTWHEQGAYFWVPDDTWFTNCIKRIRTEQQPYIKQIMPKPDDNANTQGDGNVVRDNGSIVPLSASATRERAEDLEGDDILDYAETALIKEAMASEGIRGLNPVQLKRVIAAIESKKSEVDIQEVIHDEFLTPSDRDRKLRSAIDRKIRSHHLGDGDAIKAFNIGLVKRFRKPRDEMTERELMEVWTYINKVLFKDEVKRSESA